MLFRSMQRAIQDDQKVYDENGNGEYKDNQPDVIEAQDAFKEKAQDAFIENDTVNNNHIGGLELEEVD